MRSPLHFKTLQSPFFTHRDHPLFLMCGQNWGLSKRPGCPVLPLHSECAAPQCTSPLCYCTVYFSTVFFYKAFCCIVYFSTMLLTVYFSAVWCCIVYFSTVLLHPLWADRLAAVSNNGPNCPLSISVAFAQLSKHDIFSWDDCCPMGLASRWFWGLWLCNTMCGFISTELNNINC